MQRTRIKICGITRPADAALAAQSGADALGLVFYPPSPRHVEMPLAQAIARAVPPFVTTVGLFVNPSSDEVRRVLDVVSLGMLQFHGDETPDFCASFGRPWIKAARMKAGFDLIEYAARFGTAGASGLVLDAYVPEFGGAGVTFDWSLIPKGVSLPLTLAGGLDTGNVAAAIQAVRPWGVDVSSGVECAKGVKDPDKIARFIASVAGADDCAFDGADDEVDNASL